MFWYLSYLDIYFYHQSIYQSIEVVLNFLIINPTKKHVLVPVLSRYLYFH